MRRITIRSLALWVGLWLVGLACASPDPPPLGSLAGAFEASEKTRVLELELAESSGDVSLSAVALPSGVAVDLEGRLVSRSRDRVSFVWTDSFGNSGTGTLERGDAGFRLELDPTEVGDAQPLRLYGEWESIRAVP